MKKRIALVNQRYGLEVNGGSELYTRLIAERLSERYEVDVITTKALDYTKWENYYTCDREMINGVNVLRFDVQRQRASDFDSFNAKLFAENGGLQDQLTWFVKQGPYAPGAISYIRENKDNYDVFIFVTYLYFLTVFGLPEVYEKAIFIPTAHEEPFIHLGLVKPLFNLPAAFVYLTEEEKKLVNTLFDNGSIKNDVMGTGVDVPERLSPDSFKKKYGVEDYVVYVGRIDHGKNCPELFEHFLKYKQRKGGSLKLVLMGKPVCEIPESEDIISLGFVSEEDKFNGIAGSKLLILPSKYESLSISVLEAMAIGVPVLVNGICDVLKGHCIKSNAGLWYDDYDDFEKTLEFLTKPSPEYDEMCRNAVKYVNDNYRWEVIMDKFYRLIEEI